MSAAPATCVTGEPIEPGRIARMPWHGGLRPAVIRAITARGAVDVQPIAPDAEHWLAPIRVAAADLWFLLDSGEIRRLGLPALPQ